MGKESHAKTQSTQRNMKKREKLSELSELSDLACLATWREKFWRAWRLGVKSFGMKRI